MKTTLKSDFPSALRTLRKARGLSQEEFDTVSGRTYVSALERGKKDPTLGKVEQLAEVMKVHPLTLLTLTYAPDTAAELEALFARVQAEIVGMR